MITIFSKAQKTSTICTIYLDAPQRRRTRWPRHCRQWARWTVTTAPRGRWGRLVAMHSREETRVTLLSRVCTPSPDSPDFVTMPLYVIRPCVEDWSGSDGAIPSASDIVTVVCLVLLSTALSWILADFKWVIVIIVQGEGGELSSRLTMVLVEGSKFEERENTTVFPPSSPLSPPITRKRSLESLGR